LFAGTILGEEERPIGSRSQRDRTTRSKEPTETVLEELGRRAGVVPKVLLHGSGSAAGSSPYVDPKSVTRGVRPKGRANYQILGEIARGGMGTVLKGHDTDLGRDVALKVLNEGLAQKAAALDRFVEEAQIGGQLQHPGIVPVYELGVMSDERPYFTMKLVKGRTLSALLEQRATLAEDRHRFLSIFEAVCQTVAYAHSKGVIHRDLKPANVMVGAFGEVQVVDWGLAKVLGRGGVADEQRAAESSADQTVIETVRSGSSEHGSDSIAGSVMGTPAYMSPEQAAGAVNRIDERSDVFALGAILCELLTGRPPYLINGEDDQGAILAKAGRADLDDAYGRLDESDADEDLMAICRECLMPARRQRPRNAEEVARRVHEYLAATEQRARDAELRAVAARVRTRHLALLFAVILIAVGVGSWGFLTVQRDRNRRTTEARAALTQASVDARALQAEGRYRVALDTVQAARQLVETVDADEELRKQARKLFFDARQAAAAAEQEDVVRERNAAFAGELSGIRTRTGSGSRDYHKAFREYGLNMVAPDLSPVLSVMLASDIEEEFALALDDWARRIAREAAPRDGPYFSENLMRLAIDLDPHPGRRAMREAIVAREPAALVALVRDGRHDDSLASLGPGALWVFAHALIDLDEDGVARGLLTTALASYPDDYLLHDLAAQVADDAGLPELALRHSLAVLSLRPASAQAHRQAADRLQRIGDHAAASRAYARAIELDTSERDPHLKLARSLYFIGDLDGSLAASAKGPEPERDTQRVLVLSRRGDLEPGALESLLAEFDSAPDRLNLALALVTHAEADAEEVEAGLRVARDVLAETPGNGPATFVPQLALAIGHARLERWAPALVALDAADLARAEGNHYHVALLQAHRAMAHAALGDLDDARAELAAAEREVAFLTHSHPEDWRPGSGLHAFMRRARKMVGD